MEVRNRATGDVITLKQFKAANPNTSFPAQVTASDLDGFGYDPVLKGAAATVTPPYEVSTRDGVEQIDGQWYSRFVVGPVFADSDEEAAYRAGVDADAARTVRKDRDLKLAQSDWTQFTDSPLSDSDKTAWAGYRQSLRDITAADGFPHTMSWPTEP
jgi:hypothetical protein|tara:strand:- start:395 stop:865 length:471 start_codon:yes stop_codon:yes gene_type:complete